MRDDHTLAREFNIDSAFHCRPAGLVIPALAGIQGN